MAGGTGIIRGGTVYDGRGGPGIRADVVVRDGVVAEILGPGSRAPQGEVIDASGCWVTPGFVDLHTHHDAQLEATPGLVESVRHGVTTVLVGSCGLSMAVGEPEDLAELFCRVEGIPRHVVLPLLEERVTWGSPGQYLHHLRQLPLGPNVTAMLGHSTVRAHVMGLERSLSGGVRPTRGELVAMGRLLQGALEDGYLGWSVDTLPRDGMDGPRVRSRPTPGVDTRWDEYRFFTRILRRYGAVFQAGPDVSTTWNLLRFAAAASGIGREALRTMVVAMADPTLDRTVAPTLGAVGRITNTVLGGELRFQSLPAPVVAELGAGTTGPRGADRPDRSERLRRIMDHPDVLIGSSAAGAHLRDHAVHNLPLRMLLRVLEARDEGTPLMSVGRAVHRCTAEIAGYLGIDGGLVHEGRPADIAIIDPEALRHVRRDDDVVRTTMVNGRVVWQGGQPAEVLGNEAAGQLRLPIDRPLGAVGRQEARARR